MEALYSLCLKKCIELRLKNKISINRLPKDLRSVINYELFYNSNQTLRTNISAFVKKTGLIIPKYSINFLGDEHYIHSSYKTIFPSRLVQLFTSLNQRGSEVYAGYSYYFLDKNSLCMYYIEHIHDSYGVEEFDDLILYPIINISTLRSTDSIIIYNIKTSKTLIYPKIQI